jgi:hypothetical protein
MTKINMKKILNSRISVISRMKSFKMDLTTKTKEISFKSVPFPKMERIQLSRVSQKLKKFVYSIYSY